MPIEIRPLGDALGAEVRAIAARQAGISKSAIRSASMGSGLATSSSAVRSISAFGSPSWCEISFTSRSTRSM